MHMPISKILSTNRPSNPFRGIFLYRKVVGLAQFLINRIGMASPFFKVERQHWTLLSDAIRAAVKKKSKHPPIAVMDGRILLHNAPKEVELTVDDIVEELPPSTLGSDLGMQLLNAGAQLECA